MVNEAILVSDINRLIKQGLNGIKFSNEAIIRLVVLKYPKSNTFITNQQLYLTFSKITAKIKLRECLKSQNKCAQSATGRVIT